MGEKVTVTLDGDKGMYTSQEVVQLLNEADIDVYMTNPDGEVEKVIIEKPSGDPDEGEDSGEGED